MDIISEIYAANMVLEYLRNNLGNGVWPKGITHDLFTCIDEPSVGKYYKIIVMQKRLLINIVFEEVEIVRKLIRTYFRLYMKILESAKTIDIHNLDQTCADIDRTLGHI